MIPICCCFKMLCKGVVDLDLESRMLDETKPTFEELIEQNVGAAAPDSTYVHPWANVTPCQSDDCIVCLVWQRRWSYCGRIQLSQRHGANEAPCKWVSRWASSWTASTSSSSPTTSRPLKRCISHTYLKYFYSSAHELAFSPRYFSVVSGPRA